MSVRKRTWTTKGVEKVAWVCDYLDGQGVRRLKTFERQKEARAWANETAVAIGKGTHVADSASPTVASAADRWIETCEANGLERTTVDAYRGHIKFHLVPMIGDTPLSKITVPAVRAFEDQLRGSGRSPAMIKRVIGSLGAIIADAQERGDAAHNAVREMRVGRKGKQRQQEQRHNADVAPGKDFPTPDEMRAFIHALDGRWRPALMTAAFCGLRASELRGLRWNSIDLTKRELTVIASWAINPVSAGGMGLTLKEVQERMGHASITMTADRYGHLFPRGDMASEVDAAERALLG